MYASWNQEGCHLGIRIIYYLKGLGKDFALDILAVFPLYGHFDCLFCRIIHRQVS